ncbi:MAG: (2Fe-2S)-binding protein [Rhodospirillaceae bacterium]|nr:MAG: (2Fe-2S)-binding protein [Rhodospirillaceae bacterium]
METLSLTVNGVTQEITCDPSTPLLYILRNDLGLTGAKLGCGLEQCGACAVMIDGEATFCCNRPVGEITERDIVTVEALSNDPVGGAVQRAFLAEGAAQCGYCTTGIVVAATSLLKENPAPDRNAIVAGLEDHLCRCGSHARVIAAIGRAAQELANG